MVHTYQLKNGIHVVMESIPHYRSVSLGIWVKAGSVNEKVSNNGVAHAIEHMLFKGTEKRTAKELADAMTEIGGNVDAFTTKEYTCFYAKTLSEQLHKVIDIFSDMLVHSKIDENELKKELGVIIEEIEMYDDSPEEIVHEQLQKAVWGTHPLSYLISGDKSVVRQFDRKTLMNFMTSYYTTNRMVIALSGYFNEEKVLGELEKAFADMPVGIKTQTLANPELMHAAYKPSLFIKHKDIEQVHMIMAYESIDYDSPERYVYTVANNILGGNVNSRLFQKIREELGLAYAIYTYGGSYENGGLFHIYAAVSPKQIQPVAEAVLAVIDAMQNHDITERELYIAKEQIKTELIISEESTYNRMNNYGKYLIHQEPIMDIETIVKEIEKVTAADIKRFMQVYFKREKMSLSLVGDLEKMSQAEADAMWQYLRKGGEAVCE